MPGLREWHARWWNAANLLTLSRIAITPFAVREILLDRPRVAVVLIFIAGVTDILDGFFARSTATETRFGQFLDPVADKILLSGVFLGLAWIGSVPVWFLALVFGRDLLLLTASAMVMRRVSATDLKPSVYGKACTFFQIWTAGFLVAANALASPAIQSIGVVFMWAAAGLTVFSGLHYFWRGWYRVHCRVHPR